MATMSRADQSHDQGITIYFRLVDKESSSQTVRKTSLFDANNLRERTKSQAAELVSVQSLNTIVQQLIDTEFSVFQKTLDDDESVNEDADKK